MEELIHLIQTNIPYAPYIIFGALMLAGLNIPISEDAMLFVSAVLANTYPDYLVQLFIAVYLGAYLSDLVCYWLGRILGAKLFEIRFFANRVSAQRIGKIHLFYEKYGLITILVGRYSFRRKKRFISGCRIRANEFSEICTRRFNSLYNHHDFLFLALLPLR
ncbi:VTT domain-containing protein [Methylobacter sp. G7]|uniref:DedA family protein n=1 Tax=Methylobacter sp. G7 TaxID=3230117 RepID=UPI003D809089